MGVTEAVRNPGGYTRERLRMFRLLLFAPGQFYEEYVGDRGLKTEALLVAVIGALGSAGVLYAVTVVRGEFETGGISSELPRDVSFQLWAAASEPLLGAFILWGAFTVVLYASSWLYSEKGGIFPLLKKSAWALVPLAFTNVLLAVGYAYAAVGADIPADLNQAGATAQRMFTFIWHPVAHDTVVVGVRAVGLVFVLWTGYIAAHAVADVRDIELSEAYRAAAVPVVLYVLWTSYQLAGIAGAL